MSRINSNLASMIAQSNLSRANADLDVRLQRLSTGLAINRGADNPAGLIISERLRSEVAGLNQAVANSDRASSVIATTEGALAEVAELLNSIRALVVEAASTGAISDAEREANQLQIDSAIESITRISNSASFGGVKLLNGSLDYVLSGVASSAIARSNIFGVNFAGQQNVQVDVEVVASAQRAALFMRGDYANPALNGTLQSSVTLQIAGPTGVQVLQLLSGQSLSLVVQAVNGFTQATGVSARLLNPSDLSSGMVFESVGFGSKSFVSVERQGPSGQFFQTAKLLDSVQVPTGGATFTNIPNNMRTSSNRDQGRDVRAIVNGVLATGAGTQISVQNTTSLSLQLMLSEDLATRAGESTTFHITGGGALYQLGGQINTSQQVNIGVQSMAASRLGGTLINGAVEYLSSLKTGGSNDLRSGRFTNASLVLDSALEEVSVIRGRLGAFERNTLQTNVRSLQAAIENLSASESRIRDADFAKETSALTRAQVISSAATSSLALANQQAQQVLQLLG